MHPRQSIVQYWHEEEPPDYVAELLASFRERNPELQYRLFSERSAAEFILAHFGLREATAFSACAVPAMQADYFRYCAVTIFGGIYVDADFRCDRPLYDLVDSASGAHLFRFPRGALASSICNAIFAAGSPRHPLLELAHEIATLGIERRASERIVGVTGPALFGVLATIHSVGSIEGFLELVDEQRLGLDFRGRRLWSARFFCEAIGDYARVEEAFADVRITPFETTRRWITSVRTPYHETDVHWPRWQGSIYREPSAPPGDEPARN